MSYQTLPLELIIKVAELLPQDNLHGRSLVDSATYEKLLCVRYRCITINPKNAKAFIYHSSHARFQNLIYVRKFILDCSSESSTDSIALCLEAAATIPPHQIVCFHWKLHAGTPISCVQASRIFLHQNLIRSLILSPWPDNQPYPEGLTALAHLEELELCIFSSRTHAPANATAIRKLLSRELSHLRTLRIVRLEDRHCPRAITKTDWLDIFPTSLTQSKHEPELELKNLVLQHCNSKSSSAFPWEIINGHKLHSLKLDKYIDISTDLDYFISMFPCLWALTRLEISLWDNCMDAAPEQVNHIESFLSHENLCSLQHLVLELPGSQRLVRTESIARHKQLKTLTISATDSNGWLIVMSPDAVLGVVEACRCLHSLSCTLPEVQDIHFYENLASSTSIRFLHAIGYRYHVSKTPAWSWPRCTGWKSESYSQEMKKIAFDVFTLYKRVLGYSQPMLEKLGLHFGEHYCASWGLESKFFRPSESRHTEDSL